MSLVTTETRAPAPRVERIAVVDAMPLLDTARFDHMARLSVTITRSGLVPESLSMEGSGNNRSVLPSETIQARVFLVINQAVRWGMDPFAVLSSTSVVRGKLCYEGKLVAAVLDAKLGVALDYQWDDKQGDEAGIVVSGRLPDGRVRTISGKVRDWKTGGAGSPWSGPVANRRMLAYRGAREWVRMWAPGMLLGVYTPDELDEMQEVARETRRARHGAPPPPPAIEHQPAEAVDIKVNKLAEGEQKPAEAQAEPKPAESKAPPPPAGEAIVQKHTINPNGPGKIDAAPPAEQQAADKPKPKKAPPPPAEPQPDPAEEDQRDWSAELEAFSNAAGSTETKEELDEVADAAGDLFAQAPEEVGHEAEKILKAELARIERQG